MKNHNIPIFLAWTMCATSVFSQDVIELPHQPVTFTNLAGRVYENVELERATLDGLIYSSTNDSLLGMIKYETLSTNFLASLKIPANRIQIAVQREAIRAEQARQYEAAVAALAVKERQDALNLSNAVAQAQAPDTANQLSPNAQTTTGNRKNAHHRKRKH